MAHAETHQANKRGGWKRSSYPWETWLDGQEHHLTAGVDYIVGHKSFVGAAHKYVQSNHPATMVVTTRKTPQGVVIQAHRL